MRLRSGLVTACAAWFIGLAAPVPASAQYGFGFGEMFFGGMRNVPAPIDFLNQQALTAAARGMQGPTQNRAYAPGSNSYLNNLRDPGFVSTGELSRRRLPASSRGSTTTVARTESKPRPKPAAPVATQAVRALASFFDSSLRLAWPTDSPVDGDLGQKRITSDEASLAVLKETQQIKTASLSTVTDARQKLLDYGRPALQQLRSNSTAPVADAFHQFLLSLYDSLAAAAR